MLILAVGIVFSVFAGSQLGRGVPAVATPTATAPAIASAAATSAGRSATAASSTAPSTLERRADGWYAPAGVGTLVRVERVVDGDTLIVDSAQASLRVRIFGVAAPEVGQRCGSEATARLRALVGTEGAEVRLVPDRRQQDAFGRELRYLFTPDGRSIDAALVREGFAAAWKDDGAHRDLLVSIEAEARALKRGCLWAGM